MAARPSTSPANDKRKREYLFKVLVIGEISAGKTCFVKRSVLGYYSDHYKATVGVDFALKLIKYDDNTTIALQFWDIAGQDRFGNMTRVYYKDAVGCIIVFDVTRPRTLDGASKWKTDLDNKVQLPNGDPIPCILLANKCDLAKDGLVNNAEQMDDYCREKKFAKWFETSAKENININTSIQYLVKEIMKHTSESGPDLIGNQRPSFPKPQEDDGGGCCGGGKK